jgi:hypothetical protein
MAAEDFERIVMTGLDQAAQRLGQRSGFCFVDGRH